MGSRDRNIDIDYQRVMEKAHKVNDCLLLTGKGDQMGNITFRCTDGKTRRAHIIVWERHHGPVPVTHHITRKCMTQGCIMPAHLEVITYAEREERRKAHLAALTEAERLVREENKMRVSKSGLRPAEVKAIYFDPRSHGKIAHDYGISPVTVHKIKTGKVWAHTTGHLQEGETEPKPDSRIKLTDDQVRAIRADIQRPARQVAADYGISHVTVCRIRKYEERGNVPFSGD